MAMISTKEQITQCLLEMHFDISYIRRAFKVFESIKTDENGNSGYTVNLITELIVRLQKKDENKKKLSKPIKLINSSSAPYNERKKYKKRNSKSHDTHPFLFNDIPRKINRKRNKEIIEEEGKDNKIWCNVMRSQEPYIPQWVQCVDCNKWRIVLVQTQNIMDWNPPSMWKCNINLPFNKCLLPQQSDGYLGKKYTDIQLSALDLQRLKLIKKRAKLLLEIPQKHNKKKKRRVSRDFKKKMESLKQQNDEMIKKLNLLEGKSANIDRFTLKELNLLETNLQRGMTMIKDARERLLENTMSCTVCLKNQKNIVIQECGHFDLCSKCAGMLPSKICPRCQSAFENVIVINH